MYSKSSIQVSLYNIQRHKRFEEFKQDIQARLDVWLTEKEAECPSEPKRLTSGKDKQGDIVSVLPTNLNNGEWQVFRNHELIRTFQGQDAHQQASKFADALLNNRIA